LLVGTAAIAAVAVNAPERSVEGFWSRVPGSLRLAGGHVFRGSLLLEEWTGDRLSDAVRTAEPWLTLEAVHGLVWVSKAHLVTLEADRT
jgi:hypothetical protein